ncbi:MAG: hypothetical protein AAFX81_14865 [Pseudomonadota bacterium]
MNRDTLERIRRQAFQLSMEPSRAHLSDVDNWLDAERAILNGLAEDGAAYQADERDDDTEGTVAAVAREIGAANVATERRARAS